MKQAILHFHSGDYLLVELPVDATDVKVHDCELHGCHKVVFTSKLQVPAQCGGDMVPLGHYGELIGKVSEVTEEQFAGIVNKRGVAYERYMKENTLIIGGYSSISPTAKKSFYSKMEAEGLYTENPRGSFEDAVTAPTGCAARVPEEIAWEDAEEKTFPPDRSFLFRILNQQQ